MAGRAQVTLDDVARAAGVSLATASRVVNGATRVRADPRVRVLDPAGRLGYGPNAHARALAVGSTRVMGVICHDVGDPYSAGIIGGVVRAAAEHYIQVILGSTFREPAGRSATSP